MLRSIKAAFCVFSAMATFLCCSEVRALDPSAVTYRRVTAPSSIDGFQVINSGEFVTNNNLVILQIIPGGGYQNFMHPYRYNLMTGAGTFITLPAGTAGWGHTLLSRNGNADAGVLVTGDGAGRVFVSTDSSGHIPPALADLDVTFDDDERGIEPLQINNSGQILFRKHRYNTGYSDGIVPVPHHAGLIYNHQTGTTTNIDRYLGDWGNYTLPSAINNHGSVVLRSGTTLSSQMSYLWSEAEGFLRMKSNPAPFFEVAGSKVYPLAMNDNGVVVGAVRVPINSTYVDTPFVWKRTSAGNGNVIGHTSLLILRDSNNNPVPGRAVRVNNKGEVLVCQNAQGSYHNHYHYIGHCNGMHLYDSNLQRRDLSPYLVGQVTWIGDMNDKGVIKFTDGGGVTHLVPQNSGCRNCNQSSNSVGLPTDE